MARPDKLTPAAHEAIISALSIGCTRKDAAESAGVWYTTFLDWMKRGQEQQRGKFYKFYHAVEHAEAEARKKYTTTIAVAASSGDWRAALEYLKRRDQENWGDKQEIKADVKQSGDIVFRVIRDEPRIQDSIEDATR